MTISRQPPQGVDAPCRQDPLESVREFAIMPSSHSSLRYVVVVPNPMIGGFEWDFNTKSDENQSIIRSYLCTGAMRLELAERQWDRIRGRLVAGLDRLAVGNCFLPEEAPPAPLKR